MSNDVSIPKRTGGNPIRSTLRQSQLFALLYLFSRPLDSELIRHSNVTDDPAIALLCTNTTLEAAVLSLGQMMPISVRPTVCLAAIKLQLINLGPQIGL